MYKQQKQDPIYINSNLDLRITIPIYLLISYISNKNRYLHRGEFR